jgi:hypothetical protein
LTDEQVERLTVGDRIKLGAVTGTIVQAVGLFVAIQWDEKDLPELYTRAAVPTCAASAIAIQRPARTWCS